MILIGSGEYGKVYKIGHGRVVKLFHDPEFLDMEYKFCKYIGDETTFAPQVFKRVEVEGLKGYEMEEIVGELFIDVIDESDDLEYYGELMGKHHRILHDYDAEDLDLPHINDVMKKHISKLRHFSDDEKSWLLEVLDMLPQGTSLLHGDYMPYNLIYLDDKLSALDWSDAMLGPREADIARSLYFILDPMDYEDAKYTLSSNKFIEAYLNGYYGNKTTMGIIRKWLLLNVAFEYDLMLSENKKNRFTERLKVYLDNNKSRMGSDCLF
jgi:tRNA A-37 threonylcarbamoyl transferase component Bud32